MIWPNLLLRAIPFLACFTAFIVSHPVDAGELYRCSANGKTIFSDQPCGGTPPNAPPTSPSPSGQAVPPSSYTPNSLDYSTPYGEWRTQAQYQASDKGKPVPGSHSVVGLVIRIEPAGKLIGSSPENGCKLLGVASPYITATMLSIDVTLSGCHFNAYNRRFTGSLTLNTTMKSAALSLNAADIRLGTYTGYDIKATTRR